MTLNTPEREKKPVTSERVLERLLASLLIFLPLAFGGVEAWGKLIGLGAALAICVIVCIRALQKRERFVWTWAYVPLILFFALTVLQIIPLPPTALRWIAPGSLALRQKLLADGGAQAWSTLSLYPQGTRDILPVLLIAGLIFVSVVNFVRHPDAIRRLLLTIAIIGGAVAILALLQDFSGTRMIYWMVPIPKRATGTGGPFVNYNNFSQFMNLSIGAALAVFFVGLQRFLGERALNGNRLGQFITDSQSSGQRWMLAIAACCAIAIPLSTSRAGTIAFAIGLILITGIFALRGRGQVWLPALIAVMIFSGLVVFGFERIYERLSSLYHIEEASGGRWQMNGDVWAAIGPFLPSGIGLGAHEMVYPAFNRQPLTGTAGHLENDYLQLLEEMGIPGAMLVLWFLACIAVSLIRSLVRPTRSIQAAAVGLAFGLAAVMVQSVTDFGQRIPAVACLTAIFCGLIVSLARLNRGESSQHRPRPQAGHGSRLAWLGVGIAAVCAALPVLATLSSAAAAEREWNEALRIENWLTPRNWVGSDAEYVSLLKHATEACRLEPGNIAYRHQLDVYRWYAINVPAEKPPPAGENGERPVSQSRPLRSGLVVNSPEYLAFIQHIVKDQLDARQACPTYGQLYCFAGQLETFVLRDPMGEKLIRQGYELAPSNPTVCLVAGTLDVLQGRWDDSLVKFKRCLELRVPLRDLVDIYLTQADRPDLAVALAGDNDERQLEVAQELESRGKHGDIATALEEQVFKEVSENPTVQSPSVLAWAGRMALDREQPVLAESLLRRSTDQEYSQVNWRIMYAQALLANGKLEDAMHEVRVCLRLDPQSGPAKSLLELIVNTQGNPATRGAETRAEPETKP